jgi:hypothetical protein
MKRSPDRTEIVIFVLAAALSVFLGAAVAFSSGGLPSFLSNDPASVDTNHSTTSGDTSQSTIVSESAKQSEQEKTLSVSNAEATPIGELRDAEDFDPPPGDGEEHSEEVAFAVDGDPTTTWSTEQYSGGLAAVGKDGVGVAADAGSAVKASELVVETETPGWSGEVYAANQPARDLAGWGDPVGSISKAANNETVPVRLSEPARYYLVWITDLGEGDTVELSEIRLLG